MELFKLLQMERAFLKLLQNEIFIDKGKRRIPVVVRDFPKDTTPSITIRQTGSNSKADSRNFITGISQQIKLKKTADVDVNIWANTTEQIEEIRYQIDLILFQAIANNYQRCSHFCRSDESCDSLSTDSERVKCEALTVSNRFSLKGQCPNKAKNDYESFFKKNNIIKNSFSINEPSHLDEYDATPALYSLTLSFSMDFYAIYDMGGGLFEKIDQRDLL